MQNGGVNFTDYTTVNQFLVSLNGTIQAATDSFTVSGSTITFASNLSTGDVIDFIIVFGNSLSAGTVSDSAITTAKLADSSVSLAKLTATGTKDATTFLRGDNTFAEAGGGKINQVLQTETTTPQDIASATFTDLTNISLSITPSATSSKIFVIVNLHADIQTSNRGFGLQLVRGATNIHTDNGVKAFYSGSSRIQSKYLHHELDSPNTTSATTYKVQIKTDAGANVRFNDQSLSSITLMEILA
jgi:hypothetical protein